MNSSDLSVELEKLKSEVAALKQSIKPEPNTQTVEKTAATASLGRLLGSSGLDTREDIKNQVEKGLRKLGDELGELPTSTWLLVFSLGVIVGRLTR